MAPTPEEIKAKKKRLLKWIAELEKNPNDIGRIAGELGLAGMGAAGAAAAAAVLGTTVAPIGWGITTLTGLGMVVAAPVTLVAGAAVIGGAAAYGIAKAVSNGGSQEGKQREILVRLREELAELERRERSHASTSQIDQSKSAFYSLLKQSLSADFIDNNDAESILEAIENGSMSFQKAFNYLKDFLEFKPKFYSLLKQSLNADLIDNNDAEAILEAIKDGSMSFQEAFNYLKNILEQDGH